MLCVHFYLSYKVIFILIPTIDEIIDTLFKFSDVCRHSAIGNIAHGTFIGRNILS